MNTAARFLTAVATLAAVCAAAPVSAQDTARSPAEWITLGDTVHGGFGSHIALGIRIGEDALKRLGAQRREVDVTVTEGRDAPCACVTDGVMIATSASPGQRTLTLLPKSAEATFMAQVDIKNRKTGAAVSYKVPASAIGPLAAMNPQKSPRERYDLVMATPAAQLYSVNDTQ
ncbi:MAG: formylmethanofuran dehydrogenase subunit E family protein [Pseudomonadota bacterium]